MDAGSLPDLPGLARAPSVPRRVRRSTWPRLVILVLAGLSLVAAFAALLLDRWMIAVVTYGVTLIAGGVLVLLQRTNDAAVSRSGGQAWLPRPTRADRLVLLTLVLACVGNGIVIALEVARRWSL